MKRGNARSDDDEEEGEEPSDPSDEEASTTKGEGTGEEGDAGETSGTAAYPAEPFYARLRRFARTYRFAISLIVLGVGAATFFIGILAWTPVGSQPPLSGFEGPLQGTDNPTGNYVGPDYTLAMIPGGGLLAVIGGYLAGTYIVARRRFEHLMKTKSKAEFLRNVTEAEDLLWDLTPADEVRLVRKKQDLKIRG